MSLDGNTVLGHDAALTREMVLAQRILRCIEGGFSGRPSSTGHAGEGKNK